MKVLEELSLYRSNSGNSTNKRILLTNYRSSSAHHFHYSKKVSAAQPLVPEYKYRVIPLTQHVVGMLQFFISLVSFSSMVRTCKWLSNPGKMLVPSYGARRNKMGKVTGTLFGNKMGHISFAVQEDPRSVPVLLLELATSTCVLVKAISSGLVRIGLECERGAAGTGAAATKLLQEPMWTMYCNGKKCGHAVSRTCVESDWYLLTSVQTVKAGAGVIPTNKKLNRDGMEGELMYMRARFQRVVGNLNSESYNMINTDGLGGGAADQLCIFLLRI